MFTRRGHQSVEDRTSDRQIAGKRCIHYASQDGPIHIQSGSGFITPQALHTLHFSVAEPSHFSSAPAPDTGIFFSAPAPGKKYQLP